MAADVDCHRQTGHMGGLLLNGDTQAGSGPAEALRPEAGSVDGVQQLFLQRRVVGRRRWGCRAGAAAPSSPGAARWSKLPPIPTPTHDGRAGVCPGAARRCPAQTSCTPSTPSAGVSIVKAAHVFAARALGGDGDLAACSPGTRCTVSEGGGVVPGVDALQAGQRPRILRRYAFCIAAAHALAARHRSNRR